MPRRPTDPNDPLAVYWAKPVSELVDVENSPISQPEAERHSIFSLLVMALVSDAFNGNKRGAIGEYPWREEQKIGTGRYAGDTFGDRYFGHNIACLAVDGRGEIIDFAFNHNELYNSSVEHAEARLIRRIFFLNQAFDHWQTEEPGEIVDVPYRTELSAVTLYTTLESCAQCSGIMTLANVKSVVYLQSDPGQYRIGNILYNLSNPLDITHPLENPSPAGSSAPTKYWAPEPIGAEQFGLKEKEELESAYEVYAGAVNGRPFFIASDGKPDASTSITSFLCTDAAKSIFDGAAARLESLTLMNGDWPNGAADQVAALTNKEVLNQARRFRIYAARVARRGTPHH